MTIGLSRAATALLEAGDWQSPRAIAADLALVPAARGIYGWWFDPCLPTVPREGTMVRERRALLYVGIAPNGARGTSGLRTLRDRLKDHCRGPIARSTLRRSLTALLASELDLSVTRVDGKLRMSAADEATLSGWMEDHLRVAWAADEAPWSVEAELLAHGPALPLNVAGSAHGFRRNLQGLRKALGNVSAE